MLGFATIGGAIKLGKTVAHLLPLAKTAFDDKKANPAVAPTDKMGLPVLDIADLVRMFKRAKEDGKVEKDEVVDLLVESAMIVLKHTMQVNLKRNS